ncbi:nucleotidyl transferase AbiEii/AbiGii toxin family protein [Corallococcus exiguus]|uniref:nucleotidyl transferase AbiEii/AbiGii toxin family protein n=1 Tax=Corallococcus exiguus TaxID=83462 RepID=UPI0030B8670B
MDPRSDPLCLCMTFIHEDPEFDQLLRIVADKRRLSLGLTEKDYWVTHTLWALHEAGFEVWFKGGTSLSKGFSLIQRFSEDLDLKLEAGSVELPRVTDWSRTGAGATKARRAYFEALAERIQVPGARTELDIDGADRYWRSASVRILYPAQHLGGMVGILRPFVLLEVGNARVTPFVRRDMASFVHEELEAQRQLADFQDNRPRAVRCVHPLVTLLEKVDAIQRRLQKGPLEPASFVRHYEDAARIIAAEDALPPLADYPDVRALAEEMIQQKQISAPPAGDVRHFLPGGEGTAAIQAAFDAIAPMFWGPRQTLDEAVAALCAWLTRFHFASR